jgi:hypothetical protein
MNTQTNLRKNIKQDFSVFNKSIEEIQKIPDKDLFYMCYTGIPLKPFPIISQSSSIPCNDAELAFVGSTIPLKKEAVYRHIFSRLGNYTKNTAFS